MDAKTRARYAELLRSGRWFGRLPDALQRELLAAAVARTLGDGERLFARGDPPDGLYAVVDGSLRVAGTADVKEVLLAIVEPPSWFGEISVFDGAPRTHDAIAQTAATVLHIPQRALDRILAAEPTYWRDLGLLLTTKIRLMFTAMEDATAMPLGTRLARRLLVTAAGHGELRDGSKRVVAVRQEQLATMLGTSRQTLNALLKSCEAKGLLRVAYGQIEILDFDGLAELAGVDASAIP